MRAPKCLLRVDRSIYRWIFLFCIPVSSAVLAQESTLELGNPVGGGVKKQSDWTASNRQFVVGRLERVRRGNSGATRYAIIGDDGEVAAFVAPTTAYDLRQFLGQEIGVTAKTFTQSDNGPPFIIVDQLTPMSVGAWDNGGQASLPGPAKPRLLQPPGRRQAVRFDNRPTGSRGVPAVGNRPSNAGWQNGSVRGNGGVRQVQHTEPIPADGQFYNGQEVLMDDGWGAVQGSMRQGETLVPGSTGMPTDGFPNGGFSTNGFPNGNVGESYTSGGYAAAYPGGIRDGSSGGACTSVTGFHGPGCQIPECTICRMQPASCGPPGWIWVRGEYLSWWAKGMRTPALITTSPVGTPAASAGVLPDAEVIYGNSDILDDQNSGYRLRFGGFFGPQRRWGYEAEFLRLESAEENFFVESDGNGLPILARPFFNINPLNDDGSFDPPARNDSELVAYPGIVAGSVSVNSFSEFQSAAGRIRFNVCCNCGISSCGDCNSQCGYSPSSRLDLLLGYRYYNLEEGLTINEELSSLDPTRPGSIDIQDSFLTRNDFNGGEIGVTWEGVYRRWSLEMLMNLAVGSSKQEVFLAGSTTISELGLPSEEYDQGFLVQRSNSGSFSRSMFTMIPQVNTNLGYYITPRLRLNLGYSLIYWGSVVRPGDQIDLDLNPALLSPELDPFTGPLRPEFAFRESNYWVQGLNLGLDLRW